jgi:hypothetical protein
MASLLVLKAEKRAIDPQSAAEGMAMTVSPH